jgi:hypothetical protein
MDSQEEKLYEIFNKIVAQEIAEKRMMPGLYAKAFADAAGDKDKALAIYIKLRVEDVIREGRERTRADLADAEWRATRGLTCKCDHFEKMHPASKKWNATYGRYFSPCSECDCHDFTAWLDDRAPDR